MFYGSQVDGAHGHVLERAQGEAEPPLRAGFCWNPQGRVLCWAYQRMTCHEEEPKESASPNNQTNKSEAQCAHSKSPLSWAQRAKGSSVSVPTEITHSHTVGSGGLSSLERGCFPHIPMDTPPSTLGQYRALQIQESPKVPPEPWW